MGISELVFSSGSYKTTNPPISESNSVSLEIGADGAVLTCSHTRNGAEWCKKYNVPQAEVDGLLALFARLDVKGCILNLLANPAPPMPPYMGGMESSGFSFTENGESFSANSLSGVLSEFVNSLCSLQQKCGAPFFEKEPPRESLEQIGIMCAAPAPVEAQKAEWYCTNCGTPNSGNFCTECGTQRQ